MIAIRGIRIENIDIKKDSDGHEIISGTYSLVSDTDKVLAKQAFNAYSGDIKVSWSADTVDKLNAFLSSIKKDIHTMMGLETI